MSQAAGRGQLAFSGSLKCFAGSCLKNGGRRLAVWAFSHFLNKACPVIRDRFPISAFEFHLHRRRPSCLQFPFFISWKRGWKPCFFFCKLPGKLLDQLVPAQKEEKPAGIAGQQAAGAVKYKIFSCPARLKTGSQGHLSKVVSAAFGVDGCGW